MSVQFCLCLCHVKVLIKLVYVGLVCIGVFVGDMKCVCVSVCFSFNVWCVCE